MKKLIIIVCGILFATSASASLWSYYTSRGEQLPPISERAIIAETCGISDYSGTYDQNIALEDCLTKGQQLGIAIPNVAALFETSLQNNVAFDATTMTLVSATLKNGNTLSGLYGFIIDEGSANEEFVICTASSTALSACLRGIDPVDGKTEVSDLKESHRRGASIKITDYPILGIMRRVLNGQEGLPNVLYYDSNPDFTSASSSWLVHKAYVDNRNGYWEGAVADYASLPTGVTNGETRVTLDDSKVYVWNGSAWILAGSGGGAGTIYRTDIVATSTETTYSLDSGSWPDTKYLTVFRNGVLLTLDSDYYASTTGNTIILEEAPVAGEVITLRVESIDFYNANWTEINDDLIPDLDNTHDIGSASKSFASISIGGVLGGNSPVGSISAYVTSTAPNGWLSCDGSVLSTTTYANLFAVIGYTFGGNGTSTFALPDLRGRQIVMASTTMATTTQSDVSAFGNSGGEIRHTQLETELAAHTHTINGYTTASGGQTGVDLSNNYTANAYTTLTQSTGSSVPFNVMDPFLVLNYIIKY